MADLNAFKNCSNFTDEETRSIALVRGVSAAVGCGILSFLLMALAVGAKLPKSRKRLCGTVIKRLTFGTIAVGSAYQLNFALNLVHYYYQDNRYCKVNGFFSQYFGSVLLGFVLEISLIMLFKIVRKAIPSWRSLHNVRKAKMNTFTCCGWKINKLEVLNLVVLVFLPLVINWIPFATDSYGQFGVWCWIISLNEDCSTHVAGLWEQIWLWFIPFGAAAFLVLVLFIASLCVLGYAAKNAKAHKWIKVGILDYVLVFALLFFVYFLYVFGSASFGFGRFNSWMIRAIGAPLTATFIPLVLLVTIQFPISSTIFGLQHKQQSRIHREGESKTVNESNSSLDTPYTHWISPHSSITTSN